MIMLFYSRRHTYPNYARRSVRHHTRWSLFFPAHRNCGAPFHSTHHHAGMEMLYMAAFAELESATRGTSGCSDAPKAALAFTGNFPVRPSLRPCYNWRISIRYGNLAQHNHSIGNVVNDGSDVHTRNWTQVGARAIPATKCPCPVASKDRRAGFCHPPNSFEQQLLCKAQKVSLRGRHENLMPKTLLHLWGPMMVAQL